MPKSLNPLEPSQRKTWRETAKNADPFDRLVNLTMIDTGLRIAEVAHMTPKWWHPRADIPHIKVPHYQECTIGYTNKGDERTKGAPCYTCENEKDGVWTPKTNNSANRQVPVHESDTQEILTNWFNINDIVGSTSKIRRSANKIGDQSGLDRKVVPHHLRQSFGTKLAEDEHTAREIMDLMGHGSIAEAKDYVDMYGPALLKNSAEKWSSP